MLERVLSWALALVLSALLLAVALQAVLEPSPHAVFGLIALKSGIAAFDPEGRYIVGAIQGLAALLLLFPRLRAIGGALALAMASGAVALHLSPWLGVELPLAEPSAAALAAGASAAQIAALPTDRGGMFLLALAILSLSLLVLVVERATVRIRAPRTGRSIDAFG